MREVSVPTAQTILKRTGSEVAAVDHGTAVLEAAKLMNERRIGALVVTPGERVIGIFTDRDMLIRIVAAGKPPETTVVGDVMTAPMAWARRDTKLSECRGVMTAKRIRHLPVVEDGKLYGMISSGDILASEVQEQQATIEFLHEHMHGPR